MKIISKFKDFYDYSVTGYDTDDSIIYKRFPKYYYENPFEKKNNNEADLDIKNLFNRLKTFSSSRIILMKENVKSIYGVLEFHVIGVYPKIYIIPIIIVYDLSNVSIKYFCYSRSYFENKYSKVIEIFTEKDILSKDKLRMISDLYSLNLLEPKGYLIEDSHGLSYGSFFRATKNMKKFTNKEDFIIESKKFFFTLESPIFYMSNYCKNLSDKKNINSFYNKAPILVVDCNFSELYNINLDWLKTNTEINVRDRVENFLIELSTKPIPEPNNNIKILSHGFDIKTSFRKM